MSRCHLNEHAFYELIPVVLRTSHVGLEGNRFFPLEMKIFARQVRECNNLKLETIVLSGCQVGQNDPNYVGRSSCRKVLLTSFVQMDWLLLQLDDDCLAEAAKWMTHVPSVVMSNNEFGPDGARALAKLCRKHQMGKLRSINLRLEAIHTEYQGL